MAHCYPYSAPPSSDTWRPIPSVRPRLRSRIGFIGSDGNRSIPALQNLKRKWHCGSSRMKSPPWRRPSTGNCPRAVCAAAWSRMAPPREMRVNLSE